MKLKILANDTKMQDINNDHVIHMPNNVKSLLRSRGLLRHVVLAVSLRPVHQLCKRPVSIILGAFRETDVFRSLGGTFSAVSKPIVAIISRRPSPQAVRYLIINMKLNCLGGNEN